MIVLPVENFIREITGRSGIYPGITDLSRSDTDALDAVKARGDAQGGRRNEKKTQKTFYFGSVYSVWFGLLRVNDNGRMTRVSRIRTNGGAGWENGTLAVLTGTTRDEPVRAGRRNSNIRRRWSRSRFELHWLPFCSFRFV
jgi:hypothetical protein